MKISIRPAPHSKGCAVAGREWCNKFNNNSERCETECPAGYCCEMKHCWEVGEKLHDILVSRGHEVMMADKKYRKGSTDKRANDNTKKAMKELMAWGPDVHIAIHTNASEDKSAYGIKIGYPQRRDGDAKERRQASKALAECIAEAQRGIYYAPGRVTVTDAWDFDELSKVQCPAVYIEGCYANSNLKDAQWWHNNMDIIAKSYVDALEKWWKEEGNNLLEKDNQSSSDNIAVPSNPILPATIGTARLKSSYMWKLSLWNDVNKSISLDTIKHNVDIKLISTTPINGFYPVVYEGQSGYIDKRYVKILETSDNVPVAIYRLKKKYIWALNLWNNPDKEKSLKTISHNIDIELLETKIYNGLYHVKYQGIIGYVDKRYIEKV